MRPGLGAVRGRVRMWWVAPAHPVQAAASAIANGPFARSRSKRGASAMRVVTQREQLAPRRAHSIHDVAAAAGCSPATVSRVVNGRGQVSAATRCRVVAALRRLDYRPNPAARALVTTQTGAIGLLVPNIGNPYFGELAEGVEAAAAALDYHVLIANTAEDLGREWDAVWSLIARRVDGLLIASAQSADGAVAAAAAEGPPLVLVGREDPDASVSSVVNDDFRGGFLAAEHVLALGHRRLLVLSEPQRFFVAHERARGYLAAAGDAECRIVEAPAGTIAAGYEAAARFLADRPRATAVLAQNDLLAVGVLRACREAALRVPQDVSVVGYDGTILARAADPPLTTVVQPTRDIGAAAVEMLDGLRRTRVTVPRKVVLQPRLERGETTGPAPA